MRQYLISKPIRFFLLFNIIQAALFFNLESLYAQEPFSYFKLGISGTINPNREKFHEYWQPKLGFEGNVESPFHFGNIQTGVLYLPFRGKDVSYPNFESLYIYAGWNVELNLLSRLSWINGFRVGTYRMSFVDYNTNYPERSESELGVGLDSKLSLSPFGNFFIIFSGTYMTIFTAKKIHLVFTSIEIAYRFYSPKWLTDFLK